MDMTNTHEFMIRQVDWLDAADEIMEIRRKVFVIEQRFDEQSTFDKIDHQCFHVLVTDSSGKPIGCGRLSPQGKVGKIAVLISHRGRGIGSTILNELIAIATYSEIESLSLSAETNLTHFYFQKQFNADGPVYMKQGIPFQRLVKRLA